MPIGSNEPPHKCDNISANAAAQAMGKFGMEFRAGATAAWTGNGTTLTPYASSVYCINDTTFTTLTGVPAIGTTGTVTALTAVTFPAGTWIPGKFSAVTVAGGAVMIYLA
jgi:hypothetical protein